MFNFLFNPHGRVSRSQMWLLFFLPQVGLSVAANLVDATLMGVNAMDASGGVEAALQNSSAAAAAPAGVFSLLLGLFYLWPNIAVPVKRFHDRGMTGWWVLWFGLAILAGGLTAIAGFAHAAATQTAPGGLALIGLLVASGAALTQFVLQYCLGGVAGSNAHGPDPRFGGGGSKHDAGPSWADGLDPVAAAAEAALPKAAPAGAAVARITHAPSKPAAQKSGSPAHTFGAARSLANVERPAFGRRRGLA